MLRPCAREFPGPSQASVQLTLLQAPTRRTQGRRQDWTGGPARAGEELPPALLVADRRHHARVCCPCWAGRAGQGRAAEVGTVEGVG